MKAERFEDLEVWKLGRALANLVYGYCKQPAFKNDYGFVDQIQRASISVMNNIAEGFERGSNKDFIKYLFISRGSAGELRSMLYIALDQKYITQEQFDQAYKLSVSTSRLCWGLIKYLKTKSDGRTGEK